MKEVWSECLGWIPTFQAMLTGMKDIVTVMMGVEVEMTVSGGMKGVIEDAKGTEGSKSFEILGEGEAEVLNEIGTESFIGGEISWLLDFKIQITRRYPGWVHKSLRHSMQWIISDSYKGQASERC